MNWDIIIVAVLGLLGTLASAYLTNRINLKNQEKFLQLEIEKQKLFNESELHKMKMTNEFEIQNNLINSDIKYKSETFANYSYYASYLKYSGKFYHDVHYGYLKAYNQVCTATDDDNVIKYINEVHYYINSNRTSSLAYDETFEDLLNKLNEAFTCEILTCKLQARNISTQ